MLSAIHAHVIRFKLNLCIWILLYLPTLVVSVIGSVYLYYDLSVLRQVDVLQRVLHKQGEVHLIHGHVRKCRLLQRDRKNRCLNTM